MLAEAKLVNPLVAGESALRLRFAYILTWRVKPILWPLEDLAWYLGFVVYQAMNFTLDGPICGDPEFLVRFVYSKDK